MERYHINIKRIAWSDPKKLVFWFRYLFPNQSYLEIQEEDYVLEKIKKDFANFVALIFERACLDKIPMLAKEGKLPFKPNKWGKWWTRNEEIDIVAYNDRTKEIIFAECKWSIKLVGLNVLRSLENKTKKVNWNIDDRTEYYAIFARRGFTEGLKRAARKENVMLLKGV